MLNYENTIKLILQWNNNLFNKLSYIQHNLVNIHFNDSMII